MVALRLPLSALLILACAVPALADSGQWGGRGLQQPGIGGWDRPTSRIPRNYNDSREGRVEAAHFIAEGAEDSLGSGPIVIAPVRPETREGEVTAPRERATYEAAIIDQLVKAGYDTAKVDPTDGQIAEVRIIRTVVVPQELKRKPVSGAMDLGVSNRGSMVGMALNVDLTKPKKALISTRLEARVRDRATGKALWEGHAEIDTRDGDDKWTEQIIAGRLADALFEDFPNRS